MALYQYVGSGLEPPEKTNFMSQYAFVRNGRYVDVTNEDCLRKIKNNPCFKLKVEQVKKVSVKKAPVKKKAAKKAVTIGDNNGST